MTSDIDIIIIAEEIINRGFFRKNEERFIVPVLTKYIQTHEMNKLTVAQTTEINKGVILNNIDNAIESLKELKEQGYKAIDEKWAGYEVNYFVATKLTEETDDQYYKRIANDIKSDVWKMIEQEKTKGDIENQIKELEEQIRILKSQID